jgi:murein DD-endopeptidase MepM/ murein hydrolase activator NlpD
VGCPAGGLVGRRAGALGLATLLLSLVLLCPIAGPAGASLRSAAPGRLVSVATVEHPIVRGESFAAILKRYGIAPEEIQRWYGAARAILDLRLIRAGRKLTLGFDEGRRLGSLRYSFDGAEDVVVRRSRHELVARTEPSPASVRVRGCRAVVSTTFYDAARREGIPDKIISEMVDLLSYRVDFSTEVQQGDRFRVLYEERINEFGDVLGSGRVLAADYIGSVESAAAFRFENDAGEVAYLDAEGRSLGNDFLRYPLEFTRITSAFSQSRFHPILRTNRPHMGVDFAAPIGTPVRVVGPGKVVWAGWKGGFGRHVEIDHGRDLVSAYSHLSGIHPALREGTSVERGQIIGWVGMSGLATGSHLHFAMFDHGQYRNPLEMHRAPSVRSIERREFTRLRASLLAGLRAAPAAELGDVSNEQMIPLFSLGQLGRLGPVSLTL